MSIDWENEVGFLEAELETAKQDVELSEQRLAAARAMLKAHTEQREGGETNGS